VSTNSGKKNQVIHTHICAGNLILVVTVLRAPCSL